MNGTTLRRLDAASPTAGPRPSPDDPAAASAYVPMNVFDAGNDVIDKCATVDENIYEPLGDVVSLEGDDK